MAVMSGTNGGHVKQRGKSVIAREVLLAGAFVLAGATLRGQAPSAGAIRVPESWGTATGYTTVMGYELEGLHRTDLKRTIGATYCQAWLTHGEAAARLDLPDGASLNEFAFWAYDSDPSNWLTFNVYEACQPPGSGTPTTTLLASAETFGSPGTYYGAQQLNGHTVDNLRCSYSVRVIFSLDQTLCLGAALQVQKFRVSWARQVSPAPGIATFNDVATNHPFFQFVEALSKSGITGGCGGGNYCPDQALTRGQMAVFLAKGLGLSWP